MSDVQRIPLTCPEVRHAQSLLRRICDLAEEKGYDDRIRMWCAEADETIDRVRGINRELRKAASRQR